MKYLALLLAFALVACGTDSSPTPSVDAGRDATAMSDAANDATTPLDASEDANVMDAAHDSGASDAGSIDASTDAGLLDAGLLDAGLLDAGLLDAAVDAHASTGDGGISDEVRAFTETLIAANAAFTGGTCLCQYETFGFKSVEDCSAALTGEPLSECYQMAYTAHWDALEPRLTCFADAANAYGSCMNASECDEEATSACDDAYYTTFDTCLGIAEEESSAADALCS